MKTCKYFMFYCSQDSKLPIEEHYSKKGVHPVEVYDILPDDEMWKYPCAQVSKSNHMKSFLYPERFMIHLISLVPSQGCALRKHGGARC